MLFHVSLDHFVLVSLAFVVLGLVSLVGYLAKGLAGKWPKWPFLPSGTENLNQSTHFSGSRSARLPSTHRWQL